MDLKEFQNIKLTGVTQGNAQDVIQQIVLEAGVEDFTFCREPDNPYDQFAVRVDCCTMYVGYVPRVIAKKVAKVMDSGRNLKGLLKKINRSPGHQILGLTIDILDL
ncbi:MAG: HIRAN domain-containing protein [Legionella sp.]|uniref:HIRAN domain-containing protein n=1 Tax=Legionella sp. TaxID=459 RepID=UPI002848CE0C|nr:HIRAN domain-containing protein [Legionella sp.]